MSKSTMYDEIADKTGVREIFKVSLACVEEDRYPFEAKFVCHSRLHVENMVMAFGSFNAGDECDCYINGDRVELDRDNHLPKDWADQIGPILLVDEKTMSRRGDLF